MYKRLLTATVLGVGSIALATAIALDSDAFFSAISGARAASSEGPGALAGSLLGSVLEGLDDTSTQRAVHLRVPDHGPLRVPAPPAAPPPVPKGELRAHAYQYVSRVFSRPAKRPHARGFVRRGMVLHARDRVPGPGCRGAWYALAQGGVVCSSDGFALARAPREEIPQRAPEVTRAMPFSYAKVKSHDALRFHRLPTEQDEAEIARAIEAGQRLPDVVERRLDGVYLLALDTEERAGERVFERTVRGRYVRKEDLEPKPEPAMRGELISADNPLPYAFVYGQDEAQAPVYRLGGAGAELQQVGVADNHARIRVERELTVGDRPVVVGPAGFALLRSQVRVARAIARPEGVPAHAKWIHVNLEEQALVAYEGDRPVFTTLVSSGKGEEFATPPGLYRVGEKHITVTMSGPDPDEGVYEVGEVPWTMYYDESYALHGAYWHDEFGKTRSHGCTNISPIDARWLFYWSDGKLPAGWHALRNFKGTYVYMTGKAAVEPSEPVSASAEPSDVTG